MRHQAPGALASQPLAGLGGAVPSSRYRLALVWLSALASLLMLAAFLAIGVASATAAAEFHAFSTSFGEAGVGNGQLALTHFTETSDHRTGQGSELAINQESGDLYVTDTGNKRVVQFSSSGAFIRAFGIFDAPTAIAVDNSGGGSHGDVYVGDYVDGTVSKFEADGSPVSGWGAGGRLSGLAFIQGMAVGPGGDLFILREEGRTIERYDSAGTALGSFQTPNGIFAAGLAIDAEGHLFQVDNSFFNAGHHDVTKFTDTGTTLGEPDGGTDAIGLAIEPASNDLYVLHGGEGGFVNHFALNCGSLVEHCTPLDSFEQARFAGAQGIAINASSHAVYVGDAATQKILVFDSVPGFPLTVTTAGTGAGRVTSPPLIDCGTTCSAEYAQSSTVTLTATPDERSTFTGWGAGDCNSAPAPNKCHVQVSAAKTVKAEFTAIPQEKLTVVPAGTGTGTVLGTSPGAEFTPIHCGTTCEAEYNQGASVLLTAFPEIGSSLAGWTGCNAEPEGKCEVQMNAAKAVEADFTATANHIFAINISGSGSTALSGPTEVAVDEASHDIYVNDPGHNRVEKFDSSGNFILMFGGGVDQTTGGNVCPEHPGDVCQPGSSGNAPGQFEAPTFLAVDNSGGPSAGDVYVADPANLLVQKFDSAGRIVSSWGSAGQKNGSDSVPEVPFKFIEIVGLDVNSEGELYVRAAPFTGNVFIFAENGNYIRRAGSLPMGEEAFPGSRAFKVDAAGNFFQTGFVKEQFSDQGLLAIMENSLLQKDEERTQHVGQVTSVFATTGLAFDRFDGSLYQGVSAFERSTLGPGVQHAELHGAGIEQYDPSCNAAQGPCEPINSFGAGHLFHAAGLAIDGSASIVYAANTETNDVAVFVDNRPSVTTGPPLSTTETSATVGGTVDPESHGQNHGPVTACRLEYGFTLAYGHSMPCVPDPQAGSFTTSTSVTATVTALTPLKDLPSGTEYHYRFAASNESGSTGLGSDQVFKTTAPPRIEGLSSSHVTATSADLDASVDPHGLATEYTFEYGINPEYGQTVSGEISGSLAELSQPRPITAHLEGLQRGVTYHFRLVLRNADSVKDAVSEDQTFEFFPPSCPNSEVRQQTGAAYLPDCRAYELVSPPNANATLFYAGGPNTGQATSPPRFAFTGAFSAPPGVDPINMAGDLYVSTRGPTGWATHYVGLNGDEAGCMSGSPSDGRNVQAQPRNITNGMLTDPSMNHILNFLGGSGLICSSGNYLLSDQDTSVAIASMAPYLWNAAGSLERRLPSGITSDPAALQAFQCPVVSASMGTCTGETTASGDLEHLIFSSSTASFSEPGEPQGLTVAPGSTYDENLTTGEVSLISLLPDALGEGDIPQDPDFANTPQTFANGGGADAAYQGGKEEFIRIPAVSSDGSHILMSTSSKGAPVQCGAFSQSYPCRRYIEDPLHLYMRIDDSATYEIAENSTTHEPSPVTFVGMTPDGSKVYFTSDAHLTGEDEQHGGASLYLWSAVKAEAGEDPLTLVSKALDETPGSPGNTSECDSPLAPIRGNSTAEQVGVYEGPYGYFVKAQPWTTSCGIVPYSGYRYSWVVGGLGGSGFEGRTGGSGFTPAGVANNGDIYFYSPERLDGIHGADGKQNLFVYHQGHLQYVTTLAPERRCGPHEPDSAFCSDGPIVRMQITPDGNRMAFITASRITPYDNAGHLEMYTYTPITDELLCVSCNPSGQPATADVFGSQDGLFLTDDGRTFFSTTEPLVPRDTNEGIDVYEYASARPQLITPGTGTAVLGTVGITGSEAHTDTVPGLVGVSADGTDVYFSTLDTLIPEDHNGNYLKFYDARTTGGFARPTPTQPCAAAEECHGPGTEAPQLRTQGTAARLSNGNLPGHRKLKKKTRRRGKQHHHRGHHHRQARSRR